MFMAADGAGYRLWTSAGTPQATAPLDVPGLVLSLGPEDTTELVPAAGLLFFQTGHVESDICDYARFHRCDSRNLGKRSLKPQRRALKRNKDVRETLLVVIRALCAAK